MERRDLATLIQRHQEGVYRYLRFLGADRATAEDLCQETFLAIWRSDDHISAPAMRNESAWLRGVARNLFLARCRRQRNSPVQTNSDLLARAEEIWQSEYLRAGDGADYLGALRQCLQSLSAQDRDRLDMQYAKRLSREKIARETGMSPDGVKSAMRRLRSRLATCIAARLGLSEKNLSSTEADNV